MITKTKRLALRYPGSTSYTIIVKDISNSKKNEELAKRLSEEKSKVINIKDALMISGDLFVVFNNEIYEKPKTKQEAFDMLKSFSGKSLNIITAIAFRYNNKLESGVEI